MKSNEPRRTAKVTILSQLVNDFIAATSHLEIERLSYHLKESERMVVDA